MMPDRLHRTTLISAALAAVATLVCYLPSLGNDFVNLDDFIYVVYNPHLGAPGPELFKSAFGSFYAELWIPLTWISLALDYRLWGLNPAGYHLTNALLHALNALWVALLAVELVTARQDAIPSTNDPGAGAFPGASVALGAGLLFGLLPLHVESVAWVTERKDVLNAFFALPALVLYLRYARFEAGGAAPFRDRRYLGAFLLFLLSLLSKSMTVSFPLVLLVLDWFPLRRFGKRPVALLVIEKIPFLLASFLVGAATVVAQKGTLQSFEFASPATRVLVAARAVIHYLWKGIWPVGLSPFYVHPGNAISPLAPEYLVPLVLVAALSFGALALALRRRLPALPAAWCLYLLCLFPVLGFSQSGPQAMADRFAYLPSVAPIVLAAVGVERLHLWFRRQERLPRWCAAGWLFLFCLVLSLYGGATRRMIGVWRTTETLWSRVIEIAPNDSGRAYYERAQYLAGAGANDRALRDLDVSLTIARAKGFRGIHKIYALRGEVDLASGRYREAVEDYSEALKQAPAPHPEYLAQRNKALALAERELPPARSPGDK